jgi:hypothetical protein
MPLSQKEYRARQNAEWSRLCKEAEIWKLPADKQRSMKSKLWSDAATAVQAGEDKGFSEAEKAARESSASRVPATQWVDESGDGSTLGPQAHLAAIEWVASNLYVEVEAKDAPSALAWSMLRSVRASDGMEQIFWRSMYPKLLRSLEPAGKEKDEDDPDGAAGEVSAEDWQAKIDQMTGPGPQKGAE